MYLSFLLSSPALAFCCVLFLLAARHLFFLLAFFLVLASCYAFCYFPAFFLVLLAVIELAVIKLAMIKLAVTFAIGLLLLATHQWVKDKQMQEKGVLSFIDNMPLNSLTK
ncbi:hypothetical protein Tco_1580459 [Tanacetum coccineum]